MQNKLKKLPWLDIDQAFPDASMAWDENSDAPGLLAVGAPLSVARLQEAYSKGIFPWYSQEQFPLWWSTNPRMVLATHNFQLHHSLKKKIKKAIIANELIIKIDHDFEKIMRQCGQGSLSHSREGGWIHDDMVAAYYQLHLQGNAHCLEVFYKGQSVGGLYAVSLGKMVYGESMFASATDGSKMALAALVAFCIYHQIPLIDCQQNTPHLKFMGGHLVNRQEFIAHLDAFCNLPAPKWEFTDSMWSCFFSDMVENGT